MKKPLFKFGEILLPKRIDVKNWAVVACDQHTSNPEYWNRLESDLKDPTSLKLIFPECYLSDDNSERIADIIEKQREYIDKDVFGEVDGTVLVKRVTDAGNERWGLMCLINLDEYCPDGSARSLIRATEGLVESRIPPRKLIRENCLLELPHIMLLIDDEDCTVIEPLKDSGDVLYDGELNSGGGRITGYNVTDTDGVTKALDRLCAASSAKYGEPLLFLVGDGNHSLATAKACVDKNNPLSGYALVEIVNIYDRGLEFKPIHRVLFGVDNARFITELKEELSSQSGKTTVYVGNEKFEIPFPSDAIDGVKAVQAFIDDYLRRNGGEVDYIHGDDELETLCGARGAVGIKLPSIDKTTFFDYIVKNGTLPRKTFSMGEAEEKRYYMEARRIR